MVTAFFLGALAIVTEPPSPALCAPQRVAEKFAPRPDTPTRNCGQLNPAQKDLCEKGKMLFSEKRLSFDGKVSCESCHATHTSPLKGLLTDSRPRPFLRNRLLSGPRTPSLLDVSRTPGPFFWNVRARTLESQVFWPLYHPDELGAREITLQSFGGAQHIAQSLASFMRTFQSGRAPFDAWLAGDCNALKPQEIQGARLVLLEKGCTHCHEGTELRGSKTFPLRYTHLPAYAFSNKEASYSADAELSAPPTHGISTLGSVPPTLRNLGARGGVFGRFGSHTQLREYLVSHVQQPQDPQRRSKFTERELQNVEAFLLNALQSKSFPGH
jgi:cytochrome c peroxidase